MIIFWIIYVLGSIATLWGYYYKLESGHKVSLAELLLVILGSLFSWAAFVSLIILKFGDETVFIKK